jgi:zinc/manganese transport system substrate-binding protein
MSKLVRGIIALLILGAAVPAQAAIKVLATTADWGALAKEVGGDRVDVYTATSALQDVHRVEAKPSLVARARTADLLVANGAELEVGWLPVLVRESGNRRIQPGGPGYFETTAQVSLIEKPARFDRAMGDIHPQGNPHIQLNPRNVALVAKALAARLAAIDSANAAYYEKRGADFTARWTEAIARWESKAAPLKGLPVVVMHRDQAYLCNWLGLKEGAAIEPKPGVPPSAGHLSRLVSQLSGSPVRMILRNAYNDPKAADWLSKRVNAPVVLLPFSVGGTPEAKDLFGLFDDTLNRLLAVPK